MSKVIKLVDINVVVFGGSAGNKIPWSGGVEELLQVCSTYSEHRC